MPQVCRPCLENRLYFEFTSADACVEHAGCCRLFRDPDCTEFGWAAERQAAAARYEAYVEALEAPARAQKAKSEARDKALKAANQADEDEVTAALQR